MGAKVEESLYSHVVPLEMECQLSVVSVVELCLLGIDVEKLDLLEVDENRDADFTWHHKGNVLAHGEALLARLFVLEKGTQENSGIRSWGPGICLYEKDIYLRVWHH